MKRPGPVSALVAALFLLAATLVCSGGSSSGRAVGNPAMQATRGGWRWLAGLVPDARAEIFKDSSRLEGFQINPLSARVPVRGTVELKVRYCFRYDPPDDPPDDVLSPPVPEYLCELEETAAEQTPLIPAVPETAPVTWRVNGITGGDEEVGRVVAHGHLDATYTAPWKPPSPATVSVSAEWPSGDKGKLVVTAAVEIVAGYEGTITYEDPSAGVKLQGDVLWTADQVGALTLDGSATLDLQLSSLENNCSLVTPTVTAEGELSLNFPQDGRYHFALMTDAPLISCGGIEINIGGTWLLCTGWPDNPPSMEDGSVLSGSASCDGARMRWNFRQTGG